MWGTKTITEPGFIVRNDSLALMWHFLSAETFLFSPSVQFGIADGAQVPLWGELSLLPSPVPLAPSHPQHGQPLVTTQRPQDLSCPSGRSSLGRVRSAYKPR